jgi:RNA polymerase-binding protein DksA
VASKSKSKPQVSKAKPSATKPAPRAAASKTLPSKAPASKSQTNKKSSPKAVGSAKSSKKIAAKSVAATAVVASEPAKPVVSALPHPTKKKKSGLTNRADAIMAIKSGQYKLTKSGRIKSKKRRAYEPSIFDTPVRLPPKPVTSDSKVQKNRAGLSQREIEHFRDLLLEKRRELLGDVSSMEREALRSGSTNLSNLPLHMADTGTDAYEQEFTLGLVEKDRQLLREIQGALAKLQDGSYGVCEGTGKPISKPRLEAKPWAKYSIEHARQLEKPMFRRAY